MNFHEKSFKKYFTIAEDILQSLSKLSYEDLINKPSHHLISDERLPSNITLEYMHILEEDAILVQLFIRKWNTKKEDEKVKNLYNVFLEKGWNYLIYECKDEAYDLVKNFLITQRVKILLPHSNKELVLSGGSTNFYFYKTDRNEVIDEPEFVNKRFTKHHPEIAKWIGKTGLPEEIERRIPHYIRLEEGEYLIDEESTKASDLVYLGKFTPKDPELAKNRPLTHIWHITNHDYYAVANLDEDNSYSLSGFHDPKEIEDYERLE